MLKIKQFNSTLVLKVSRILGTNEVAVQSTVFFFKNTNRMKGIAQSLKKLRIKLKAPFVNPGSNDHLSSEVNFSKHV